MKDQDYLNAVKLVATERRAGNAFLRQRLLLSESKVQRLLRQMEKNGVISPVGPGGVRQVLAPVPVKAPAEPQNDTRDPATHV